MNGPRHLDQGSSSDLEILSAASLRVFIVITSFLLLYLRDSCIFLNNLSKRT